MGPWSGTVEAFPLALCNNNKRRKLQQPRLSNQTQHPELAANTQPNATITNGSLKQATKPAAKSTAKFVPLAEIPLAASSTPVGVGTVSTGASILIIQEPWLKQRVKSLASAGTANTAGVGCFVHTYRERERPSGIDWEAAVRPRAF